MPSVSLTYPLPHCISITLLYHFHCMYKKKKSMTYATLGRSPGGRHGNQLQYSCLENLHGHRSLEDCVHGITKSQT